MATDEDRSGEQAALTAFVISPIGAAGSRERRRADGLYDGVVVPSLDEFDLRPSRADRMEKPGTITTQIVREIVDSTLVIADLTDLNSNVFYELGIADAFRKPVIRFIDSADRLPFDAKPERTIELPDNDGHIEVLGALEARDRLQKFLRAALDDESPDSVVAAAERRASWEVQPTPGSSPERQMLEILLERVEQLGGSQNSNSNVVRSGDLDLLGRIARSILHDPDVEVLPGPHGLIVDIGGAIRSDHATAIVDRFEKVVDGVDVTFLHGTWTAAAPPAYDMDEEPF